MKTKNIIFASAAMLAATFSAHAETAYWTGNTPIGTNGWGLTSEATNWSTGVVPTSAVDVVFDMAHLTGAKKTAVQVANGFSVNNYTIANGYGGHQIRVDGSFNVAGNFTQENAASVSLLSNGSGSGSAVVNIGGSLIVGQKGSIETEFLLNMGENTSNKWGGWGGPKNVTIGGDITMYERGAIYFNTNLEGRVADYSKPDIDVKGVVNFSGNGTQNPNMMILNKRNPYKPSTGDPIYSEAVQVVFSCNGINGNGAISNTSAGSINPSQVFIVLRNNATQTFSGWVRDGVNCTTKLVMNGTGTQVFTSSQYDLAHLDYGLQFSGGVEVISGTLDLNYGHQVNHGDLEMRGGKFKNNDGAGSKNINFTNLIYEGGVIVTRWNGTALDVMTLSGGLLKGDHFAPDGKFYIEITGDLSGLVGNEKKIFGWDNITHVTDFVEGDFVATALEGYEAIFAIKDDGLYVSYAIPEPATVAALLGALALGLAVIRRRK